MGMSQLPTWSDVINKVLEVVRNVIYTVASKIGEHATTIAEVAVGLGVLAFITMGITRAAPFLRRFLAGIPLF